MSAIMNHASVNGVLGVGSVKLNDYLIEMTPIDGGYRLTVTRGSEVQTMDIMDGRQGVQGPQGEPGQDAPQDVVRYSAQELTADQQEQARVNIGAADVVAVNELKDDIIEQKYFDYSLTPMSKGYLRNIILPNLVYGKMINDSNGELEDKSGRFSTSDYIVMNEGVFYITVPSTLNVKIFRYDYDTETYSSYVDWKSGVTEYKIIGRAKYRFSITNQTYWMNISSPEYQDIKHIKIYSGEYTLAEEIDMCKSTIGAYTFEGSSINIMYRGNYLPYNDFVSVRNKSLSHIQKLIGCGNGYQFMFFTDAHCWYSSVTDYFIKMYSMLQHGKNYTGINDVYNGGDIVLSPSTKQIAIQQIALTHGECIHLFGSDNYFPIIGNHEVDDNYGNLTNEEIIAVMFNKFGNTFYTVERGDYTSVILDSGGLNVGGYANYDEKIYSQFNWIYNIIKNSNSQYFGVFVHITTYSGRIIDSMSDLLRMFDACNSHTSVTINNTLYDYSNTNKTVEFVMSGHIHNDSVNYSNGGIPVITTINCSTQGTDANFDLAFADFDNKKLYLTRVGNGDDRTINIP